jgi:tape measure domain-containing protein
MAERLTVTIDGDSSGLTKSLQSAENRLNSFNTRLTNASRGLTSLISKMATFAASAGQASSAFNKVTTSAMRMDGALGSASSHISALNRSIATVIAANSRMAGSMTALATRMNSVAGASGRVATAHGRAARSTGMLNVSTRDLIMTMTSVNTLIYTSSFLFGGIIKSTIEANSKFERMNVLLKNVSGGADEAKKQLLADSSSKFLWDMADNAPFKMESLLDTFVKLKAAGIDPTTGSMQALVDTVAHFGGDSEQMKRAGVALSQMLSKGKVTAEELRQQLGDAVPNAMKDMAKALDMTIPQLDAKMKKGLVMSADAVPKLMELWKKQYGGGAASMMNTWDGMTARMQNAWQKMIIRVTKSDGDASLFGNLKKQMGNFTEFLSSKQGDKFMSDVSQGLGRLVTALADAGKFVYKYREEIIAVGSAIVKLWAFNKFVGILGQTRTSMMMVVASFRTFMGVIPTTITLLTRLYNIKNGLQLVALLFGRNVTRAAASLGLFTTQLQISAVRLAALTGLIGLAMGAVYLLVRAYQANAAANTFTAQATAVYSKELKASDDQMNKTQAIMDSLTFSTDAERAAVLKLVVAKAAEVRARLAAAQAAMQEAKVKYQQDKTALIQKNISVGEQTAVVGSQYGMGMNGLARQMGTKKENQNLAQSTANLQTAIDTTANNIKELEAVKLKFDTIMAMPIPEPKINATPTGGGKAKKDKLGSTDDKRGALVSALNKAAELEAKNEDLKTQLNDPLHKETSKAQNAYADNFETIDNANKALANTIKSQADLNAKTTAAQALVKQLTIAQRDLNDQNHTATENMNALNALEADRVDAVERAKEAVGNLNDAYVSIEQQLARYGNNLRERYKEQLNSTNAVVRLEAQTKILEATEARRTEILGNAATKAKENADNIFDSLLTEDQLRERNYQREMSRIGTLIEESKAMTDSAAKNDIQNALERERQAVVLKNKIDSNPWAKWAAGIKDMRAGINDTLVGSMDGFIDQLASGKLAFADFAKSLVTDLIKVIVKAYIAKALLGALGLGGDVMIGSGASGTSSDFLNGGGGPLLGGYGGANTGYAINNHTGSIVGSGKGSGYSKVDMDMFNFAQRYHTGGITGLRPDEVPIIAQKGEGVFTAEQMKAMGTGKQQGGQKAPMINIINQTNSDVQQDQAQPRFDGEQMIVDVILKHGSQPGPVRNMFMGQ